MLSISYTWMSVIPQTTCQHIHLDFFRILRAPHLQFNEPAAGNCITIMKPCGYLKSLTCQHNVIFGSHVSIPAVLIITNLKEPSSIKRNTSPETGSNPSPKGRTHPVIPVCGETRAFSDKKQKNK